MSSSSHKRGDGVDVIAPAVSILLPFRDAASTLPLAVSSIQEQTFAHWELLLLDDGSSEEESSFLLEMVEEDQRIRLFHLPPEGIVAALNKGIEHARGEFLARMDSDDVCHPERLERQVVYLQLNPDVDLVSCRVAFGGDRDAQAGYAAHVDWLNGLITHEEMFWNRFVDAPVAHPSVMFRRSAVEKYGGYSDGDFPEDFELWLRWLDQGARFGKVPETLLTWNDSPGRLSRIDPRYGQAAFYRTKCDYLLLAVPDDRPIWLWGAGRPTRKRFELFDQVRPFSGFIDIDPQKIGRTLNGRLVVGPDQMPQEAFVLLGVANPGSRERVVLFMQGRGKTLGIHFLAVA